MSSPHATSSLGGLADVFADPGPNYPDTDTAAPAAPDDVTYADAPAAPPRSVSDRAHAATGWMREKMSGRSTDPDDEFAQRASGPTRQVWITRGLQAALLAALLCGPLALMFGGGSSTPTAVTAQAPTVITDISPQLTASDLAARCVPAWLQAAQNDQASLGQCFDSAPGGAALPDEPIYDATDARSSAVHRILPAPNGAMIYSVTVSVAVRPAGSTQPANRRYYRLPVVIAGSSVRALSFPAQVPAPPNAVATTLGYDYQPPTNAAIVTAASGFLSSMLTGDSTGVSRFTSPGTRLSAITPAPLTSLAVTAARSTGEVPSVDTPPADGEQNRLLLTLTERPVGADVSETMTASYALSMTARAGRWEVTSLDLAPPIAHVGDGQTDTALGDDQAAGNTPTDTGIGTSSDTTAATAPTPDDTTAPTAATPAPQPAPAAPVTPTPAPRPNTPAPAAPGLLVPGGSDLGPRN